ncbi:MAG: hypothetical protein ACJ79S_07755 [Gemmatimonadaceae bacterium]
MTAALGAATDETSASPAPPRRVPAAAGPAGRRALVAVAALALATQVASATWLVRDFESPNAATDIARHMVRDGEMAGGNWARLKGETRPQDGSMRAFHLPAHPLYLAAGMRALPPALTRYWSVPVTVTLIVAVAYVALLLGGARLALATGAIGALLPFTVLHGPVWDDVFLGSAAAWAMLALVGRRLVAPDADPAGHRLGALLLVAGAAAVGALTRSEEQAIAGLVVLLLVAVPGYRRARAEGVAIAAGVALALAAWGARNEAVLGRPFIGSTHDGISVWESNGAHTDRAIDLGQVEALSTDPSVIGPVWARTRDLSEIEADAVFRRTGLAYIREHPVAAGRVMLRKLAVSLAGVRPELPLLAPRNLVALLTNLALFAGALVGLVALRRRSDRVRGAFPFLAVVAAVTVGLLLVGPIGIRYWITLQAALWVLSGAGLLEVARVVRGRLPRLSGMARARMSTESESPRLVR